MTVFINGKQVRMKPPAIEGIDAEEFYRNHADPLWLHQNEMWEYIDQSEDYDYSNSYPMKDII